MSEKLLVPSFSRPDQTVPLRRGVIAIILRPEIDETETPTGRYNYYCLDHKTYNHDTRHIKAGVGLMSETFESDEDDPYAALARSFVEEILGQMPRPDDPNDTFMCHVRQVRETIINNLRTIGQFEHSFNYHDRGQYFSNPDAQGTVLVMVDDRGVLPVGDVIGSEEVCYAGYLDRGDLDHPYIHFRSGYDMHYLLKECEKVKDILNQADITLAG